LDLGEALPASAHYCMLLPAPRPPSSPPISAGDAPHLGAAISPACCSCAFHDSSYGAHLDLLSCSARCRWWQVSYYGIKPAVTAIVVFAAYRIGIAALKNAPRCGRSAPPASSPFSLLGSRSLTSSGSRHHRRCRRPPRFRPSSSPAAGTAQAGRSLCAAIIDDDTPRPRTRASPGGACIAFTAAGLALWAGAMTWL